LLEYIVQAQFDIKDVPPRDQGWGGVGWGGVGVFTEKYTNTFLGKAQNQKSTVKSSAFPLKSTNHFMGKQALRF